MRWNLVLMVLFSFSWAGAALADADFHDVFRITHRRPDGVVETTTMKKDQVVLEGKSTNIGTAAAKQFQTDLEKALPLELKGDVNCVPSGRWEFSVPKKIRFFCRNASAVHALSEITAKLRVISSQ